MGLPRRTGRQEARPRSIRAAYARVAEATGIPEPEVRAVWLDATRFPGRLTTAHAEALEMLRMSEDVLHNRIEHWIVLANRLHPQVDGYPRFVYAHTHNSKLSPAGWPDMVLMDRRHWRLYVWEEKREDAEPTGLQQVWLDGLERIFGVSQATLLGVIRPSNRQRVRVLLEV